MTARLHPGRPANDNAVPPDVTRLSLKVFGTTIIAALIGWPLWLVSVW